MIYRHLIAFILMCLIPPVSLSLGEFFHVAPEKFMTLQIFVCGIWSWAITFVYTLFVKSPKPPKQESSKKNSPDLVYTEAEARKLKQGVFEYVVKNYSDVKRRLNNSKDEKKAITLIIDDNDL